MISEPEVSEREKREQRRLEQASQQRREAMKEKWLGRAKIIIPVLLAAIGGIWLWLTLSPAPSVIESDIISRTGVHWHPELSIVIRGEKQAIPNNIGLVGIENPIHTHDETGQIHLEFPGLVTKESTKLYQFFKVWDKRFDKECIFDHCNGPDGKISFFVNGVARDDYEQYEMKDLDKIEIRYE
jgi:hypothetical protein